MKATKPASILLGSAIVVGMCFSTSISFATPPDIGDQSGAGSTNLTMVWQNADTEYMGTEEPETNNPDDNNDGLGDNLAFKAPSAINFVAKANGELLAPSTSSVYIENFSAFEIRVSSMQVEQESGWNIVENASNATGNNDVWGSIGPVEDALNWYLYRTKDNVTTPCLWNMQASGSSDKLYLKAQGHVANLSENLSSTKKFGTIHWYLKAGSATGPNLPTSSEATLSGDNASLANLSSIGSYLRSDNVSQSYVDEVEQLVGKTITVELNSESEPGVNDTMDVMLVDVSHERGLTFQALDILRIDKMNTVDHNSTGGWKESDLRHSMNQTSFTNSNEETITDGIYPTYFQGTDLDSYVHPVDNQSLGSELAQGDKYWLASCNNIYGPNWPVATGNADPTYSDGDNVFQFDYYRTQTPSLNMSAPNTVLIKKSNGTAAHWWLRSCVTENHENATFEVVHSIGILTYWGASGGTTGVVPCFCL